MEEVFTITSLLGLNLAKFLHLYLDCFQNLQENYPDFLEKKYFIITIAMY